MDKLVPIEFKNQRILTTRQLAEVYGADEQQLQQNFNNHQDKYIKGVHYYYLEGDELKDFKRYFDDIEVAIGVSKFAPHIYLWTVRGASRHCKILDTNKAWEQFDNLEEKYFNPKSQTLDVSQLSQEMQMFKHIFDTVARTQIEQAELQKQITTTIQRLDNIKDIVALNPTAWRTDTSNLITKMALKCGGYEHIRDIRDEVYGLLDERYGVQLNIRLTNKRKTLALNGVCKSKIDKLNKLDVIADDKKLIEGFIAIVKELSIKYGIDKTA